MKAKAGNPVFNSSGKSWTVRYGGNASDGNKRGDLAVQLQIQSQGGSDTNFVATLYRYDSFIVNSPTDIRYKKLDGAQCKIVFSAATVGWDAATSEDLPLPLGPRMPPTPKV